MNRTAYEDIERSLRTHISLLRKVQATLFKLAISDSSPYAQLEGELAAEIAKLIIQIEIDMASSKRFMEEVSP